jgi:hypothetical protein
MKKINVLSVDDLIVTKVELAHLCNKCKKRSDCNHWTHGQREFTCLDRDKLQSIKILDSLSFMGFVKQNMWCGNDLHSICSTEPICSLHLLREEISKIESRK